MTIAENNLLPHIVSLTKKFIAVPSTEDNNDALHEVLTIARKELEGYFAMEEFESNGIPSILVHNTNKRTKHFKIILNAHLDVVPGRKKQFKAVQKDGKLYGRGAYDMKAAAAVMITLFKNIAKDIEYPLALQLVTDEEIFSEHTTRYQIKKGIRGEFVICGECSSNFKIKNQSKGTLWIRLKSKGKTAHGGYPWRGENAIWKLTNALHKIKELYPIPQDEAWITTINLATIKTDNTATNAVPDTAYAELDIRFIAEEKDTIIENIQHILPQDIQMEVVKNSIPTYVSPDNSFVTTLKQQIEKVTGQKGETQVTHATSDIRFYNEVDCLGVEFGPIGAKQHEDNEWVDIRSLEDYYHILKNFLLSVK